MEVKNISIAYFSATGTTKKIIKHIAAEFDSLITQYDITLPTSNSEILLGQQDLLILGMPVYAGRIPQVAVDSINRFKGTGSPAIIVCVYGNRDYDDALLELKDLVEQNGFKVVSAGTFIAQHSIFPAVGSGRPDKSDLNLISAFARKSISAIHQVNDLAFLKDIHVKGNKPYKTPGRIPLRPKASRKCDGCGVCVRLCPTQAILAESPRKTDKHKCISCARCIAVCPQKTRSFGGLLYRIAGNKFVKANSIRKEPEVEILDSSN